MSELESFCHPSGRVTETDSEHRETFEAPISLKGVLNRVPPYRSSPVLEDIVDIPGHAPVILSDVRGVDNEFVRLFFDNGVVFCGIPYPQFFSVGRVDGVGVIAVAGITILRVDNCHPVTEHFLRNLSRLPESLLEVVLFFYSQNNVWLCNWTRVVVGVAGENFAVLESR